MTTATERLATGLTATGLSFSLVANVVWAAQPLYWPLVDETGAIELLAHRVVWSAVTCLAVIGAVPRRRAVLAELSHDRRQVGLLSGAGACLALAWGIYIYAVNAGHVVEGSLGLFMVPLSTVLAGVLVFGERLRSAQWFAIAGACVATGVLTIAYGRPPWIALTLCVLMAIYASVKKKAGAPPLEGFTLECLTTAPLALGLIVILTATGEDTVVTADGSHLALVVASGFITAVPLLGHAASLHHLPLTTVGILQYLNPSGQFLIGVYVRHEEMSATRWVGFAFAWAALVVFAATSIRGSRGRARPGG